ncbi:MAG: PorT family protein [Saprospiraceae bacterium]|nr:PorT family protein [Saprospiraceae bacterium]
MKNHSIVKQLLFACCALLSFQQAQAQFFNFGLKGGLNTQINKPEDIIQIGNDDGEFNLGVDHLSFGTQFGAFMRFGNRFFIQPEVLFNSNKTDYKIGESSVGEVIKNEKYQYLDIPVMVGFKLGPVRIQGGPVGHYFLNSKSELTDFNGYEARFKQMTWGYQTGLSIGFGRLSVDARYEGNFSKFGNHITFFGDQYQFSSTPARFILGVNFALIK